MPPTYVNLVIRLAVIDMALRIINAQREIQGMRYNLLHRILLVQVHVRHRTISMAVIYVKLVMLVVLVDMDLLIINARCVLRTELYNLLQ